MQILNHQIKETHFQLEGKIGLIPKEDNLVSLTVSKYGIKVLGKSKVWNGISFLSVFRSFETHPVENMKKVVVAL